MNNRQQVKESGDWAVDLFKNNKDPWSSIPDSSEANTLKPVQRGMTWAPTNYELRGEDDKEKSKSASKRKTGKSKSVGKKKKAKKETSSTSTTSTAKAGSSRPTRASTRRSGC
ncbi:hypothetical protein JCM3765_006167 [Sporobolomyces pararoseus]